MMTTSDVIPLANASSGIRFDATELRIDLSAAERLYRTLKAVASVATRHNKRTRGLSVAMVIRPASAEIIVETELPDPPEEEPTGELDLGDTTGPENARITVSGGGSHEESVSPAPLSQQLVDRAHALRSQDTDPEVRATNTDADGVLIVLVNNSLGLVAADSDGQRPVEMPLRGAIPPSPQKLPTRKRIVGRLTMCRDRRVVVDDRVLALNVTGIDHIPVGKLVKLGGEFVQRKRIPLFEPAEAISLTVEVVPEQLTLAFQSEASTGNIPTSKI